MGWNKSEPTTATKISQIASLYTGNWQEIDTVLNVEHYNLSSTLSGNHKNGIGFVLNGTTSQISALSGTPGSGALVYDTSLGIAKVYDGSSWKIVSYDLPHSSVSAVLNGDTPIPNNYFNFSTEYRDVLGELGGSPFVLFTPKSSGVFLIQGQFTFSSPPSGIFITISSTLLDTSNISTTSVRGVSNGASNETYSFCDIAYVSPPNAYGIIVTQSPNSPSITILGSGAYQLTFIKINRLV